VHEIVLDPFESAYRPVGRVKTNDRVNTDNATPTASTIPSASTAINEAQNDAPTPASVTSPEVVEYPIDLKDRSQQYEIDMIKQALADSQFNQKKTAEKLSLTYHQLRGYLKKYNLLDSSAENAEKFEA
jgi:psp operon transcriptional activator